MVLEGSILGDSKLDDEDAVRNTDLYDEDIQRSQRGTLDKLTTKDLEAILERCYEDPVEFCKFFLDHLFSKDMPWVHRGILAIITRKTDFLLKYGEIDKIVSHFAWSEDPNDDEAKTHSIFHPRYDDEGNITHIDLDYTKYNLLMMPRGFSKTTLIGIAVILYQILYREKKFIIYISETASHAEMQIANVKSELVGNELIRAVWGNLQPDRYAPEKWTASFFETTSGVTVACRGRGGQVRGLNHKGQRPDEILFDDVEDKESVRTDDRRVNTREWFYGDVIPALPAMDPDATIVGLGTLLHPEALLMTLSNDPEWTFMRFSALDNEGTPLWPDNMTVKDIENKKKSFALAGQLHTFYMEYMSELRTPETQKFRKEMFTVNVHIKDEMIAIALVVDPAISEEKATADFCAFAAVGMSEKGLIGVLDYYNKIGMSPREQVDKYFEMSERNNATLHGVEAIAYQKALVHLIREEMFRKKQYFEIECITHGRTGKHERINGVLQPRYANNYIVHARRFPDLETQLLDYPRGKIDGPDVVAMAITLLDPYAAQAADPDLDLGDDEYKPLSQVFGMKDWRQH